MLNSTFLPSELIQELFGRLAAAFNGLTTLHSNRAWTAEVKRVLREMGEARQLKVYPDPNPKVYEPEFLLDTVWRDERPQSSRKGVLELAVEIEWGRQGDIKDDFEKLVLVKSPFKLMICDPGGTPDEDRLLSTLACSLASYADHRRGEIYVVADVGWKASCREFSLDADIWVCPSDGAVEPIEFTEFVQLASERLASEAAAR